LINVVNENRHSTIMPMQRLDAFLIGFINLLAA